jgi:hypothetical protein
MTRESLAQNTDVGFSGSGLISIQPVDDAYVGGPYLNEGIGGAGFGFGAGINVITPVGFVAAVEYSTARFEQEQYGRLVGGGYATEAVPHTTRLHDSLLTVLGGVALGAGPTRVVVQGGLSAKLDSPTVNGEPREASEVNRDQGLPFVPTGGLDLLRSLSPRASAMFSVRYSFTDRAENHQYLGIGPHILRVGAGLRVRVGG